LFVCATGRSFRQAKPRELLRYDATSGWLSARMQRQGVRHEVRVELEPARRAVRVDGRLLRQTSRLLEVVNVVAFFPDDLRIVKGSPEERRQFFDRAVANHQVAFVERSLRYLKVLKTRNALLRRGRVSIEMLAVYDAQLMEHGLEIHRHRLALLSALAPLAQRFFQDIMHTERPVSFDLVSGIMPEGESLAGPVDQAAFQEALRQTFADDCRRGVTHIGPHRADVVVRIDGQPARQFASQGQQRALVLALKLAETTYLRERLGCTPLLLLDDVSSELDRKRCEVLFSVVAGLGGQTWVTTTNAQALPLPSSRQVFTVEAGIVT
jgi:DNA replication and repair protein RecF